jgi:hypothetical protein
MWPRALCIKGREELDAFSWHFVHCIKFHRILCISKIARIFWHLKPLTEITIWTWIRYPTVKFFYSVLADYYLCLFVHIKFWDALLINKSDANSFQVTEEFTCILWYMNVHYLFSRAHHSSLSIKLINPIHFPISSFFQIYFNITAQPEVFQVVPFSGMYFSSPPKVLYASLVSPSGILYV